MRALTATCVVILSPLQNAAGDPSATPTSSSTEPTRDVGLYVVIGALAVNSAFTIYDLATINTLKPDLYGLGEIVLSGSQALVWGGIMLLDDEDAWQPGALALWSAGLAVHGIYTMAADRDDTRASSRTVMLSFGSRF